MPRRTLKPTEREAALRHRRCRHRLVSQRRAAVLKQLKGGRRKELWVLKFKEKYREEKWSRDFELEYRTYSASGRYESKLVLSQLRVNPKSGGARKSLSSCPSVRSCFLFVVFCLCLSVCLSVRLSSVSLFVCLSVCLRSALRTRHGGSCLPNYRLPPISSRFLPRTRAPIAGYSFIKSWNGSVHFKQNPSESESFMTINSLNDLLHL